MPLCNGVALKRAPPQGGIVIFGECLRNGVPKYFPAGD
jgi:hypothetical protein